MRIERTWIFPVLFIALAIMITIKNAERCNTAPPRSYCVCFSDIDPGPDDSEYCCKIDYQVGHCISHLRVWGEYDFVEIKRGHRKRTFAAKSDQVPAMNEFLEKLGCCKRFKFIGTTLVGYLEETKNPASQG